MSDLLCYSLPNIEKVEKKCGIWVEKTDIINAFFVSNFNKTKRLFFEEAGEFQNATIDLVNLDVVNVVSKEEYQRKVSSFVKFCNDDETRKVVLSRNSWSEIPITNALSIFENLVNAYPSAFVYLIQSTQLGCWIGATPEKLLRGENDELTTMSLAGTRSVDDPFEWTDKEIKEQIIVTDYISEILNNNEVSYRKSTCSTVQAGSVEHLSTEFRIDASGVMPLELASQLHPTPAVSGVPKLEAIDFINSNEGYDRKLYTGIIGWSSAAETELFVNLRCAQLFSNGVLSYVGGGITKDSDPEKEWMETEFKSQTLLSVIQKM